MQKVKLISSKTLFKKFVGVDELHFELREQKTDIRRFVVTRPDASAILIFNKSSNKIVLIRQFRAPIFTKNNDGFVWEVPAGIIEKNESAEQTIIRETLEETGYKISSPKHLSTFFPSCGLLNEEIHLFYAEVEDKDKIQSGGGLDSEDEYLEVVEFPVEKVFEMLEKGEFIDGKTMLSIFYFKNYLNR